MEEIATKESWTTHPLPEKHVRLKPSWSFTESEIDHIKRGLIPEQMEDKWFIFHGDGWLHFHRSWTGYCIYQVQFRQRDSKFEVAQILVSRDLDQHRETSEEYDLLLLKYLIDSLLLEKPVNFPHKEEINGEVTSDLHRHHR